jgi:hypothetical protein
VNELPIGKDLVTMIKYCSDQLELLKVQTYNLDAAWARVDNFYVFVDLEVVRLGRPKSYEDQHISLDAHVEMLAS